MYICICISPSTRACSARTRPASTRFLRLEHTRQAPTYLSPHQLRKPPGKALKMAARPHNAADVDASRMTCPSVCFFLSLCVGLSRKPTRVTSPRGLTRASAAVRAFPLPLSCVSSAVFSLTLCRPYFLSFRFIIPSVTMSAIVLDLYLKITWLKSIGEK